MIPGEVIHLIKRMVVISHWIKSSLKRLLAEGQRFSFILCQEIIAIVGIVVADTGSGRIRLPRDRTYTIEEFAPFHHTRRHFLQIVSCCQVITRQTLWLQTTAIAINLHFRDVRDATTTNKRACQLVDAALRDSYLRPDA